MDQQSEKTAAAASAAQDKNSSPPLPPLKPKGKKVTREKEPVFLAIDIEARGPSLIQNGIVGVGMAIGCQKQYHIFEAWRLGIKPLIFNAEAASYFQPNHPRYNRGGALKWNSETEMYEQFFDADCMANFWNSHRNVLDNLAAVSIPAVQAASHIYQKLRTYFKRFDVTVISDNPSFDIGWLNFYLNLYSYPSVQQILMGRYVDKKKNVLPNQTPNGAIDAVSRAMIQGAQFGNLNVSKSESAAEMAATSGSGGGGGGAYHLPFTVQHFRYDPPDGSGGEKNDLFAPYRHVVDTRAYMNGMAQGFYQYALMASIKPPILTAPHPNKKKKNSSGGYSDKHFYNHFHSFEERRNTFTIYQILSFFGYSIDSRGNTHYPDVDAMHIYEVFFKCIHANFVSIVPTNPVMMQACFGGHLDGVGVPAAYDANKEKVAAAAEKCQLAKKLDFIDCSAAYGNGMEKTAAIVEEKRRQKSEHTTASNTTAVTSRQRKKKYSERYSLNSKPIQFRMYRNPSCY